MDEITFELIILDAQNCYFDTVGEYINLAEAETAKAAYTLKYPEDNYTICKVTREYM